MKSVLLYLFMGLSVLHGISILCKEYQENSDLYYGSYSADYLIRWGYQALCHHTHDPKKEWHKWPTVVGGISLNPEVVKPGDILFVRDALSFFKDIMPHIICPFIMVTAGESWDKVTKEHLQYLSDEKILAWFSIHPCKKSHPKLYPIPLGILQEVDNYSDRVNMSKKFAELRDSPKQKLLHMNFDGGTEPPYRADRKFVYEHFITKDFCTKVEEKDFDEYLEDMAEFKFTLSPQGTGPDAYRTWEALLVGTIPIVKTSHLDQLYTDLPVLIVKNWEDVTKEFLKEKYAEIRQRKYNIEKLFIKYWAEKIHAIRNSFLEKNS